MNLAERVERVLFHATNSHRDFWPEELYSDIDGIINRYRELKRTLDFESAARQAKVEWLGKVIADDLKKYVIIGITEDIEK